MKIGKKIVSVILVILMVITIVPFSAFAEELNEPETQTQQEITHNATNALGEVIADAMDESDEEKEKNGGYGVFNVSISGLDATVNFSASDDSTLVVAVYEEETMKIVTSGKIEVNSDMTEAVVELADCNAPDYYVIKAFILNNDNAPVCQNYENRNHTKIMEEFFAKSVEDFDENKIINFDYSNEDNFAVISDDAVELEQTDDENILVRNDYENGIYVFENANSDITSLQSGDVLFFTYGTGSEDYILTKIGTIANDNGTVTITVSDDYEISDFFSYIDLDTAKLNDSPVSPMSFDDDKGEENGDKSFNESSGEKNYKAEGKYSLTIDLSASITAHVSFRYDFHLLGKDYYEFAYWIDVNASASIKFEISGSFSTTQTLISVNLPIFVGLDIHFELKMTFKASAAFTAEGSLTFTMKEGARRTSKTGQESLRERPKLEYKVEVTGNFQIDIIPEITAGFTILAVFPVDFNVSFDCVIKGTLFVPTFTNGESDEEKKHLCSACLDGSISIIIKGNFTVKFIKKDIINTNAVLNKTINLGNFYVSLYEGVLRFGWGTCPNYEGNTDSDIWGEGGEPDYDDTDTPNTSGIKKSGTCGDNLTYILYNDGELVVSGWGEMKDYAYGEALPGWDGRPRVPWYSERAIITKITIQDGVTNIGENAFMFCPNVKKVTIGDSVTHISDHAFYFNDSLENIKFGNSVTHIGDSFYGCDALKIIEIPASVSNMNDSDNSDSFAFRWCASLTSIIVDENNKYYSSDKYGVLFNKDKTKLILCPRGYSGEYAIPASVTNLGYRAFAYCEKLVDVAIPDSVANITSNAFFGCESLTNVKIPNSVINIGYWAFYACYDLESIIIGNGVTSIDKGAFSFCNSLRYVYYTGSKAQWENITIAEDNEKLTNAKIVFDYSPTQEFSFAALATYSLGTDSETLESAIIGNSYIMLIVKDKNAEDLLSSENLLYIDQKTAESETLTFEFELKEDYPDYKVIFSGAKLTSEDITPPVHEHEYTETVTSSNCIEDGYITYTCSCGDTYTETISATGHTDKNLDGICDSCGDDLTKDCSHICHSSNAFIQFIYKLVRFLWRLFGMETNRYCVCGKAHW